MRTRQLTLVLTTALALLLALGSASAAAATFGGLGRIGELTIRSGETKGDVELEEHDAFVVEPSTGAFYVADETEEPERLRVQKFDGTGKFLGQAIIKLGAAHEVELRAMALDAEKHKLYVLADGSRSSSSKHDASDPAAAAIYSISTEVHNEELEATELVEPSTLLPYSQKAKQSLIEPAGLAVDPKTHDILISAQQDEDISEAEELHSVIQRVHENGSLGPRYVDSQNCLNEGQVVAAEPHCEELGGEQPDSLIVTQGGRTLVELEQADLWEIPDSANASGGFKEEKIVPRQRFALPEATLLPQGAARLSGEEAQTGTIAYVATGAEEGRIYASAEVSATGEPEVYGVMLLNAVEHAGELTISEVGWTGGQNKTSKQTKCEIPFSAEMPMEVGGTAESVQTFGGNEFESGGKREVEPYLTKFGTTAGAEACGHVEVTVPTVQVGTSGNLQEVPLGKPATLGSKVEGADALATTWTIVRNGEAATKEVIPGPVAQGRTTSLTYTFKQAGSYEITEAVTTDNLGSPSKQVVRKINASLPAITFKIEPSAPFPEAGVSTGTPVKIHVAAAKDPNETTPHVKLTWHFSDGSAPKSEEIVGKESSFTATIEHSFASNCGGVCVVTLEAKDTAGAEGHAELKVPMFVAKPPPGKEPENNNPPPPPPPPPPGNEVKSEEVLHNPEARIAGSTSLTVKPTGSFTLQASCPPKESECVGTVTLQVVVTQAAKKGAKPKKVKVVLARGSFTLAGGAAKVVSLHLSGQGRSLLSHLHVLHATATLVSHDSAVTRTTTANVTLRPAKGKH
jgi:hypothetical protein